MQNDDTSITADFESGSIGNVEKVSNYDWIVSLKNDNDNDALPDRWRSWWYFRMENTPVDAIVSININNRGWPYFYIPVYSYDNKTWFRFEEDEVSQPSDFELTIKKKFIKRRVWLARFYPYTFKKLQSYLEGINSSPYVFQEVIGQTAYDRPIKMLTLTDFSVKEKNKKRVWIHARTHPAETGGSFLVEGLIDFLISGSPDARQALSKLIFHIVPMQNIDGVVEGNYRSTPDSLNLEVMWYPDLETPDPLDLESDVPLEIIALNNTIRELIKKDGDFTIALNLHSSNSEPKTAAFFFPHFGPESLGYSFTEADLWNKQISFINYVGDYYNNRIEPLPTEGGRYFASRYYPESWWWKNFKNEIMAITMETVYGRGGSFQDWLIPDDLRELGHAVGLAIMAWNDIPVREMSVIENLRRVRYPVNLRFPNLYPPKAKDELKGIIPNK